MKSMILSHRTAMARHPRSTGKGGFSLVEVTLAMAVASFCLFAILGLMVLGVRTGQASSEETALSSLAAEIAQDLRSAPEASGTSFSPRYQIPIPAPGATAGTSPQTLFLTAEGDASGSVGAAPTDASRYRVSLSFSPPATGQRYATLARVLITWPAASDPDPTTWPTRQTGSFETVVALGRN